MLQDRVPECIDLGHNYKELIVYLQSSCSSCSTAGRTVHKPHMYSWLFVKGTALLVMHYTIEVCWHSIQITAFVAA